MSNLEKLQLWYKSQCNEDWEHQFGIRIDTLDNPGWKIEIDLEGTSLQSVEFEELTIDFDSENNWIICKIKDNKFIGVSGPLLLDEMILIFLNWCSST